MNRHIDDSREELSDYREVLDCMRRRLEKYGMIEALEPLERLDDALLRAIIERLPLLEERRALN